MKSYDTLFGRYEAYVDSYRDAGGSLPEMMELKRVHTAYVVRNAEAIAAGEAFDDERREVALAAALLHDTGRYEQLRLYDTFKDSASVDHAVLSHGIVKSLGWLDDAFETKGARKAEAVLAAVLYHNRREIPCGLDSLTETAAHAVRDADKLDIFRVLEDRLGNPAWRDDARAFWNLQVNAAPSPEVARAIAAKEPVDYGAIRSLSDFVLVQVGWMVSGLHFATSRRLCAERGHLAFRRRFLHTLTDAASVDGLCDLAEKELERDATL